MNIQTMVEKLGIGYRKSVFKITVRNSSTSGYKEKISLGNSGRFLFFYKIG